MTSKITTPTELSDTAFYLEDYSKDRNLEYPQNYVFSTWGKNRVYNFHVNGESRSYSYAKSNYGDFVTSTDPEAWYDRLNSRAGFVVTTAIPELGSTQTGAILHRDHGSRTSSRNGVGHYRLIYISQNGRYKAFELVSGAVITGQVTANTTVTATTEVDLQYGSFNYERQTTADSSGNFSIRVAHPGTYLVACESVFVPKEAVWNGRTVRLSQST